MSKVPWWSVGFACVVAALGAAAPAAAAPPPAAGAPGALSHFDLSRKDCVGTASERSSKVWFTVANGVLSDVYEPTIDTTNVETMQYVVTDGETFTDLQSRDTTYTVRADATGMACTVTSTAKNGAYRLETTYATDTARDAVLVRTRLRGLSVPTDRLQLHVRLDPTVAGHGGGGTDNAGADDGASGPDALVASDETTATAAANRDYAVPTHEALRADRPFLATSAGYAGSASDGLTLLDADRTLGDAATSAPDGNVVLTGRLDPRGRGATRTVRLALGFGRTADAATAVAGAALARPFGARLAAYRAGWDRYDRGLRRPARRVPGLPAADVARLDRFHRLGVNVLKASEDKTFPGAIAAGLGSPWGQAVSAGTLQDGKAPYFGSYREVFGRDLYEAFTGLLAAGDASTARAATRFLLERQQLPDGRIPRNSLLNGRVAPDTGGDQLDETAYPLLMAWQSGLAGDRALYRDHVRRAADFVVARGPSFGVERWEEQGGYSPSTIAAEIAGLVAAGRVARVQGDLARSRLYLATADHFQRSVKGWTVTTTGPYATGRYFIRLSRAGDPDAATTYNLGNGSVDADQRAVVDAGFLELPRLGILPADDADVTASLPVVDAALRRSTPAGDGFYRYGTAGEGSEDGYGDCHVDDPTSCEPEGKPWPGPGPSADPNTNKGSGHLWPVLSGERAEQELQTGAGADAAARLRDMSRFASGVGLVPEQTWENPSVPASAFGTDPGTASIGFEPGRPAGSAAPLTWAQAQAVRLRLSVNARRPVEQPRAVRSRYVDHAPPAAADLAVATPVDGTQVEAATTTVTGTTAPRARVVVAASPVDTGGLTSVVTVRAGADGSFTATVPTGFGTTTLTTTVVTPTGATGYDQRAVSSDVITGTTVLDVADPEDDDNGPGTFRSPTSADFRPGAFDLTRFQVLDAGETVFLRARVRDLSPTFGDALGAQLLSVFVHDPAAATTSTAPLAASRNYRVADADAWSRALEVRGFAPPRFVDATGTSAGDVSVQASRATGYVTIGVPRDALGGTPGSGWRFTVVLHGQDGFGQDGARGFTATPEAYTFGRCAQDPSADPRCQVPLDQLPKAIDTIVPAGVQQADELDRSRGPVLLQGVPVP